MVFDYLAKNLFDKPFIVILIIKSADFVKNSTLNIIFTNQNIGRVVVIV